MFLTCMSICRAVLHLAHMVLQISAGSLEDWLLTHSVDCSTLWLPKTFRVPVLSFHITSAEQAKPPESFSRRIHTLVAQKRRGCGNLSSDWSPKNALDPLGCFYLVSQTSGILQQLNIFSWSWVSLGALRLDPTKCTLTACPVPFNLHSRGMLGRANEPLSPSGVFHWRLAQTGEVSQ